MSSEVIELKGGLTVPVDAVRLAVALEMRGFELRGNGPDLIVRPVPKADGPGPLLTNADRDAVRRWKPALLRLVAYEAPEP